MAIPNRRYEVAAPLANRRNRFHSPLAELSLTGKKGRGKQPPPEVTHAENFYYLKQMNSKTPMVIVLTDGEQIHGCIEWYDRTCLKLNRDGAPNLVIQKHSIKYLFKHEELPSD
jgi:host factor-I protein